MTNRTNTRLNALSDAAKKCDETARQHERAADLMATEDNSYEAIWHRASAEAWRHAARTIRKME